MSNPQTSTIKAPDPNEVRRTVFESMHARNERIKEANAQVREQERAINKHIPVVNRIRLPRLRSTGYTGDELVMIRWANGVGRPPRNKEV